MSTLAWHGIAGQGWLKCSLGIWQYRFRCHGSPGRKRRHPFAGSQVKLDITRTNSLNVRMWYCTVKVCFLQASRKFQIRFRPRSTPITSNVSHLTWDIHDWCRFFYPLGARLLSVTIFALSAGRRFEPKPNVDKRAEVCGNETSESSNPVDSRRNAQ